MLPFDEYNESIKKLNEKRDANLRLAFIGAEIEKAPSSETIPISADVHFEVGNQVQIINRIPNDWRDPPQWTEYMNEYVGKTGVVRVVSKTSIGVLFAEGGSWNYKPSWLTLVGK